MRFDSCRMCGKELEIDKLCEICNLPITFSCHACGNITEKQFHPQCTLLKSTYVQNIIKK
jgi:hypothetical protein